MTENVPQDSVRVMNMLIIFLLGAYISYHLSLLSSISVYHSPWRFPFWLCSSLLISCLFIPFSLASCLPCFLMSVSALAFLQPAPPLLLADLSPYAERCRLLISAPLLRSRGRAGWWTGTLGLVLNKMLVFMEIIAVWIALLSLQSCKWCR